MLLHKNLIPENVLKKLTLNDKIEIALNILKNTNL
jgi:hypothetical protein